MHVFVRISLFALVGLVWGLATVSLGDSAPVWPQSKQSELDRCLQRQGQDKSACYRNVYGSSACDKLRDEIQDLQDQQKDAERDGQKEIEKREKDIEKTQKDQQKEKDKLNKEIMDGMEEFVKEQQKLQKKQRSELDNLKKQLEAIINQLDNFITQKEKVYLEHSEKLLAERQKCRETAHKLVTAAQTKRITSISRYQYQSESLGELLNRAGLSNKTRDAQLMDQEYNKCLKDQYSVTKKLFDRRLKMQLNQIARKEGRELEKRDQILQQIEQLPQAHEGESMQLNQTYKSKLSNWDTRQRTMRQQHIQKLHNDYNRLYQAQFDKKHERARFAAQWAVGENKDRAKETAQIEPFEALGVSGNLEYYKAQCESEKKAQPNEEKTPPKPPGTKPESSDNGTSTKDGSGEREREREREYHQNLAQPIKTAMAIL